MYKCNLVEPCIKKIINNNIREYNNRLEYRHYLSFNAIMAIVLTSVIFIFLYVTRRYKPTNDDIRENNLKKYTYIQDKFRYVNNSKAWNDHPEIPTLYGVK